MSANKIASTQSRAVRTISILLLTILAFAGIAFAVGATSFKLGLDLQGGTSVTLQPRIEEGQVGKVTTEAIDQAVGIIRQRVNSLGVAESEVSAQGSGVNRQIIISVPGETGRRIVDLVGQTAELRFRPVLAVGAPNATTTTQSTSANLSLCSAKCEVFKTGTPLTPATSATGLAVRVRPRPAGASGRVTTKATS